MARKPRAEVEGGLYHVITRGNNRRRIFNSRPDYVKFLKLLATQKAKLPFFLYAYCLMTNHVHLLIERQADELGRIMHRLLTGYSKYYNRRYRRVGHLLQARHKATLCQSDRYLSELVRYIHLNPVRARIVKRPEEYEYSGHRAYLGLDQTKLVDVDPVLRHFGRTKRVARDRYKQFVLAGIKLSQRDELYQANDGRFLGTDEFVDATIHRIGQTVGRDKSELWQHKQFNAECLCQVIESVCRVTRQQLYGPSKDQASITAKELFVLIGHEVGASLKELSEIMGLNSSTISRRNDSARMKVNQTGVTAELAARIRRLYHQRE